MNPQLLTPQFLPPGMGTPPESKSAIAMGLENNKDELTVF
jgi:hypothetical protein